MDDRGARAILFGGFFGGVGVCYLVMAIAVGAHAQPAPAVHYAPAERLEVIDVGLIDGARRSIDMAAYVLTDAPVIDALERAAQRGVVIRILLDRGELEHVPEPANLIALQGQPTVTVHVKRSRALMHLKSYAIDGRVLRTGSANFTAAGLNVQDNDLVVIESKAAAAGFTRDFEAAFSKGALE